MTACLAATGSNGLISLLLIGLLLVAAAVAAFLVAGLGRRAPRSNGRATALLLVAALGLGVGTGGIGALAGAASFAEAAEVACATPAPAPAPAPPVIADDRDVVFDSGGVTFHGSYRGPVDPSAAVPAVVIVVGTGAVDRDGNAPALATEAYRWLADQMSAEGVASLRYDKLGTGATGLGSFAADPDALLPLGYDRLRVQPIRDALSFLAVQPGVDASRLLLLGHSEGGADALVVATDPGDAPAVAGLLLIEPAYTHILDIVARQFTEQIDAAVAGGAMTAPDAADLEEWMSHGIDEIRTGTPPYPDPDPVPLPAATGITAVYQDAIASNIYGSDPAQMVITHAYRTAYGKGYDAVDPGELSPQVTVPTLITCGTKDFNTPCGDGASGSGVLAVADAFPPGVAQSVQLPDMVHILRDVGSADVPAPADQIAYPFSTALQRQLGDFIAQFTEEPAR
ncbi:alpha/beta hydrolase family protein [Herbiconiux ginsengi]|uniref:Serine aminopeptidase S33 domain-containing protein n=1 Tax=Herbiconiux ginsengi TaxID=381665 RepID=A0A1H3REX6_9MICO|nr:hypothetical protein [Herbiconiux ginsengi]SDZ24237.1 hypothetical protein SAMN05216554_2779 [Herbiconiux ginsengi]